MNGSRLRFASDLFNGALIFRAHSGEVETFLLLNEIGSDPVDVIDAWDRGSRLRERTYEVVWPGLIDLVGAFTSCSRREFVRHVRVLGIPQFTDDPRACGVFVLDQLESLHVMKYKNGTEDVLQSFVPGDARKLYDRMRSMAAADPYLSEEGRQRLVDRWTLK